MEERLIQSPMGLQGISDPQQDLSVIDVGKQGVGLPDPRLDPALSGERIGLDLRGNLLHLVPVRLPGPDHRRVLEKVIPLEEELGHRPSKCRAGQGHLETSRIETRPAHRGAPRELVVLQGQLDDVTGQKMRHQGVAGLVEGDPAVGI